MPPIGELRVKEVVGLLTPANLSVALKNFSSNYYNKYIVTGSPLPIFHGAALLTAFNLIYHRPHENHYYETLQKKFVIRTGIEDGFTVVGVTGNPLGCINCPVAGVDDV